MKRAAELYLKLPPLRHLVVKPPRMEAFLKALCHLHEQRNQRDEELVAVAEKECCQLSGGLVVVVGYGFCLWVIIDGLYHSDFLLFLFFYYE